MRAPFCLLRPGNDIAKTPLVLAISLLFLAPTIIEAQSPPLPKGKARIHGLVVDPESNTPVEFANVALVDPATNRPVDGGVCDAEGKFDLPKLSPGSFRLVVTFVGYETVTRDITIGPKDDVDVGTIILPVSKKLLDEVVVEGQRMTVEEKIDRMVYNAENDQTTKGGDAADVLKRVPLLTVDVDGNVQLRGSPNVLVLINNKPSTITATSVSAALKQIPADMIKTVEVITSPSSKYDAEGAAGIINIILKKNTLEGIFFNLDATTGNRASGVNLNNSFREGRNALSFTVSERLTYNVVSKFSNSQTTKQNGDTITNIQSANNLGSGSIGQYLLGWDFDINKYNRLSTTVRYGRQSQNLNQNDLVTEKFQYDNLLSSSTQQVKNTNVANSVDASLAYTKLFAKKDREWSFMAIYSRTNPHVGFTTNTTDPITGAVQNGYRNENTGYTEDYSIQLDAKEPLTERQFVEFGVKDIVRNVTTNYKYFISDGPGADYQPTYDPRLTNGFTYDQKIRSAYMSYSVSGGNGYSLRIGSRYEYTSIDAAFENQPAFLVPSYGVLVPTFNLSRKLNDGRMIRFSYNRRIQRPSLRDLNPNLQASNPLNASIGNPNLKPEYTDNVELAFNTSYKIATFNLSTFMRYNTNDIQPARSVRGDTIISIAQNIGTEANYGVSAFTAITFTDKFSVTGGADVFYRILKNNSNDSTINGSNQGFTKNFRASANYSLPKNWTVQLFATFQGKNYNLQGYRTGVISQSFSIRKDIMKRNGSLGLAVDNFVTPAFNVYSNLNSPYLDQRLVNTLHNFMIRINFSMKIGKLKVSERKTGLGNED